MAATRDGHGRDAHTGIREHAVRLGAQANLVGIVTEAAAPRSDPPAVIVLNAGVLHRVGPHRLHVNLARRLAKLGFACMRLDLAGIGDSLAVAGDRTFRESAVADTRTAMDALGQELGIQRFVVFGLCSGADNALATAALDPRVAGIVILDPPTYATTRSRARKLRHHLEALGPRGALGWGLSVVRREVRARLDALRAGPAEAAVEEGRETPPLATYRAQLRSLRERGVKILAIYSGGLGDRYNQVDQLFEYAPELRDHIDHAYFPQANHVFTERGQQRELVDTVAAWIDRQFR